jgi:hypothetical protein
MINASTLRQFRAGKVQFADAPEPKNEPQKTFDSFSLLVYGV